MLSASQVIKNMFGLLLEDVTASINATSQQF